jgi:YidC/Oxa1 family membrane protein insertase
LKRTEYSPLTDDISNRDASVDTSNQRNLILAVLLTALILFGWDSGMRYFYPNMDKVKPAPVAAASPAASASASASAPPGGATRPVDLKAVLAAPTRVPVAAPGLIGSISTLGGTIDDLSTVRHTARLKKQSGPQRVFSPAGTPAQQFAQFGWTGQNVALPSRDTVWSAPAGAKLTPETPLTLTWTSPAGLTFALTYAIDADYLLTVTQKVTNGSAAPVSLAPVAQLNRSSKTEIVDSFSVHVGPIGAYDEVVSFDTDYSTVDEATERTIKPEGKVDWIGFTDTYWLSTLIPEKAAANSDFRAMGKGIYLANLFYDSAVIAPGQTLERTTRLFAGAKESAVLDRYEEAGIAKFGLAIDWGWFRWFEKPIFWLLNKLFELSGNFGVAIILLTVVVRGLMFPIAQKQFASMAAMRAIQPKMKALQERYKDDKQKQQQEVMALYKSEGVNPLAGCLPIFLQIPVFFALYKVLIVAIEMRHQPFALWIKDLSAPDPFNIAALAHSAGMTWFPAFLGIGILAVMLGITMWLQFKLNPAAMDPVQQQVFAIMPWMMMFIMAPFAAGLLIYWNVSNILTIAQQWYLYSKHPQLKVQAEKDAEGTKRADAKTK